MDDLKTRIAEAINTIEWERDAECTLDEQAHAVIHALGLREETGVTYYIIGGPDSPTPGEPNPANAPHFRRYVTEWEEVEWPSS